MRYVNNRVVFQPCDMLFLKKYGIDEATRMIEDFYFLNSIKLPFVTDSRQLASTLRIRAKHLYSVLKSINSHYTTHKFVQKNGKVRIINEPSISLKSIQRTIYYVILQHLTVSKYAKAYRPRVTIKQNAVPHIGKKYLLKMDIKDFFPSITFTRVYGAAFNANLFPKHIGTILTTLCCKDDCLPQGAPTSPALSNLVMKNFDEFLGKWCEEKGIAYTRYCDDLTFSSDKPLYGVYLKAKSMLENMGFEVNEKKTKFITSGNRQTVTGLTVNQKLNISSVYKRKLRQDVYYALKFGPESAIIRGRHENYIDNGKTLNAGYLYHLLGKVNYVLSIENDNKWFYEAKCYLTDMILKYS